MGHHRRYDRRHKRHQRRIIFFNQIIHTRTTGCNHIVHLPRFKNPRIFLRDKGCTLRSFPHGCKSKAHEPVHDLTRHFIIHNSQIRWRNGYNNFLTGTNIAFHLFQITDKGFRILRTDFQAFTAEDTIFLHDLCLCIFYPDGLHRTGTDTFIAMLAARLFEINNLHRTPPIVNKKRSPARRRGQDSLSHFNFR